MPGHGSGRVTKDEVRFLAGRLVAEGYAVLRYDKRGVGQSTGVYENVGIGNSERMISTLAMINRSRKQALPYSIVPTLFDRRTQASLSTLRLLRDTYPEHLWPAYIPVDTRLRDASRAGVTPSQYDANSRGVIAYRALLKHMLALVPASQVA